MCVAGPMTAIERTVPSSPSHSPSSNRSPCVVRLTEERSVRECARRAAYSQTRPGRTGSGSGSGTTTTASTPDASGLGCHVGYVGAWDNRYCRRRISQVRSRRTPPQFREGCSWSSGCDRRPNTTVMNGTLPPKSTPVNAPGCNFLTLPTRVYVHSHSSRPVTSWQGCGCPAFPPIINRTIAGGPKLDSRGHQGRTR
jgi:hypothetical protein